MIAKLSFLKAIAILFLFVIGVYTYSISVVSPVTAQAEKVIICHAAGLEGTDQFVTLELAYPAVYGPGGHFNENGTTQAGHEDDYLGPCSGASPSVNPSASPSPSVEPSPSPSVAPSASPSPAPSASSTPTPSTGGSSDNSGSGSTSSSSSPSIEGGEVLGDFAGTGVVEDVIMNALGSVGGLMTMAGSLMYGKKRTKK